MSSERGQPRSNDRAVRLREEAGRARDASEELRMLALDLRHRILGWEDPVVEIAGTLSLIMISIAALYAGLADLVDALAELNGSQPSVPANGT